MLTKKERHRVLNPIEWHAWGDEAFEKAKRDDLFKDGVELKNKLNQEGSRI